ncbi:HAMP domain-containing sensor histidine kinase, partial [Pseudophaeobacter sp.]
GGGLLPDHILAEGLFGLSWLRPQALFGIEGLDSTVHAVLWSMSLNAVVFCLVSLMTFPSPIERLQGAQFVNVFEHSSGPRGWTGSVAQSEDLMVMSQRILGATEAQAFFQRELVRQGGRGTLPEPTPAFLERLERELGASIGAAAAHAMIGQIVGGSSVSVQDLLAVADETAQMLEYSNQLEEQSAELSRTARQLRVSNEKLTQISQQKDAFLSQVSHELRTPMTSIRAFSEILRDEGDMPLADKTRYATIIHDEALRLTRLLNDLLDLSVLESGQVSLNMSTGTLSEVMDHAISTALAGSDHPIQVHRDPKSEQIRISSDLDRLAQVFINLIANAQKYCDGEPAEMTIRVTRSLGEVWIDFTDNGSGVPADHQQLIFEKFSRVSPERAGGAGLGLAICREIMQRLEGDISYLPGQKGGSFRISLPFARKISPERAF